MYAKDHQAGRWGDPREQLLEALLRAAAADGGGDQDAVTQLHRGVAAMSARSAGRAPDRLPLTRAGLGLLIRSVPWGRPLHRVSATLLLDVRAGVLCELFPYAAGYPILAAITGNGS